MKKNNLGISLISLIITIIVIIILAAIVIFSGLGTPDQANFASFASGFSDFELAVTNDYMNRYTNHAITGKTRSKSQIYYEIASGVDVGINGDPVEVDTVENLELNILPEGLKGKEYYEIVDDTNVKNWKRQNQFFEAIEKHYVTDEGEVFFLPGYLVEEKDGSKRWWISENQYYVADNGVRGPASIEVSNLKLSMDSAGTVEAGNDIEAGTTTLYINFSSSEDGASVSVSPSLPYAITVNGTYNFTLTSSSGKTKTYTVIVDNFKEPTIAETLEIGDYVEYTPVTASTTYITNPPGSGELYTGAGSKELTQETELTWRVIKVDESTGEVLITTTNAVNTEIILRRAPGYLNHKNILDDICKTLYSNTELGITARSMKIEDLDYTVSDSTTGYAYYPKGTPTEQLIDKEYNGVTYAAKEHSSIPSTSFYDDYTFWEYDYVYNEAQKATYTNTVTVDGKSYNYAYNYAKPISVTEGDGSTTYYPVLVSGKRSSLSKGTYTSSARACLDTSRCWLASSRIALLENSAQFYVRGMSSNNNTGPELVRSTGSYFSNDGMGVRPVVSLGSTLKVDISDTSRDGSSFETAWKIIKK